MFIAIKAKTIARQFASCENVIVKTLMFSYAISYPSLRKLTIEQSKTYMNHGIFEQFSHDIIFINSFICIYISLVIIDKIILNLSISTVGIPVKNKIEI